MNKKNDWICYRPEYQYKMLEFDIIHDGFEELPLAIFNLPKAITYFDKDGKIWVSRLPDPRILVNYLKKETENYLALLFDNRKELRYETINLTKGMRNIISNYKSEFLLFKIIQEYKNFHTRFLPFIIIVSLTDSLILREFEQFLGNYFPSKFCKCYISSLLTSLWAKISIEQKCFPPDIKKLSIPAPSPIYYNNCESICEVFTSSQYDDLVKNSILPNESSIFNWYRTNTPIFSQWGDENLYLMAMVRTHFNLLLEELAGKLFFRGVISHPEDILNLRIEEIERLIF